MSFEILNKNPQHVSPELIKALETILQNGEPAFEQEYRLGVAANENTSNPTAPSHKFDIGGPDFNA